jgi:hypothetical protein
VRLPRLPEGFSLRKPAVLALVVVLLGGSAIFGLTADNMRSQPTPTTKDPDIAEFDPVLASFNFRKTAQSSLAMAVSFLRQAQSGAYDLAAVAPKIEAEAKKASEALAGANRAVDTANTTLEAAKRSAKAADSPGGTVSTTEENEGIRSLEAGVQAAVKYRDDTRKFKEEGTDKLLAAVKQAQKQQAKQPAQTGQPGQLPGQLPGQQPGGPVLAAPQPGAGQGPVAQPPSWLGPNGGQRQGRSPGAAGQGQGPGDTPDTPVTTTTTTTPKPLSPCASLEELEKIAKKAPEDPAAGDASPDQADADQGASDPGAAKDELSPTEAAALVKVCKALKAHKAQARDPNATNPSPEVQALITAATTAVKDRDAFAAELKAEVQTDPKVPPTGFFITQQFVQPANDAKADYEMKSAAATTAAAAWQAADTASQAAAAASQAAEAARAANPADQKLVADAAAKAADAAAKKADADAKKVAADKAKKDADTAKKLWDDIQKIADEVSGFELHITTVQTRQRPVLPADTKLPARDKTEAAWVVLLADLEVKRDAAAKARAASRAALALAEKTMADLVALPADTAPAARDALVQDAGEQIVDTLVAWRTAIAAIDAEAESEDMASMAQQLWARADAKARGVKPPEAPTNPPVAPAPAAQAAQATQNAVATDPVDPQAAQPAQHPAG